MRFLQGTVKKMVQALREAGIRFTFEEEDGALGVKFTPQRPSILRYPTIRNVEDHTLTCPIESRGKKYTIAVSLELLDDADGCNYETARAYLQAFQNHQVEILNAARKAIEEGDILPDRRVYVTNENSDLGSPNRLRSQDSIVTLTRSDL